MGLTPISPIAVLLPHVLGTLERIAPERVDALLTRAGALSFELTDQRLLGFASVPEDRLIRVSQRGLEFLWTLSYAAWALYLHRDSGKELVLENRPETAPIPKLLEWAYSNQILATYRPWPLLLPRPVTFTEEPTGEPTIARVASELCLCAVAWILHHELTHVANQDDPASAESILQENRADREATEWILSASLPGPQTAKRGLGIAISATAIAGVELFAKRDRSVQRTHANPAQRIFNALDHPSLDAEGRVHEFAAILLKLNLDLAKVELESPSLGSAKDSLREYCIALHRHLE